MNRINDEPTIYNYDGIFVIGYVASKLRDEHAKEVGKAVISGAIEASQDVVDQLPADADD